MKKLLCTVLTVILLTGAAVPALAADSADARLAAVTSQVKEILNLDTDAYDTFSGNFYEDALSPVWNLSWSGDGGSLSVEADEDSNVISYYLYDKSDNTPYSNGFSPTFPKGDELTARTAASAFLERVLDAPLETVILEPDTDQSLNTTRFSYSGCILLNGLTSPFSYYITVRASDNAVIRFSRDSLYTKYLGDVPSATPSAAADAAGSLLKTTLALRLEYVLSDDDKTAVLRYLPESGDTYYVDAQTGGLVDLTELYQAVSDSGDYGLGGEAEKSASAADESAAFTDAEQAGITQMEGVLSKEALDQKLQAIPELGLARYTLTSASYSANQADGTVTCRLQYSEQTDDGLWRRYVTVDGKTGALQSVYSCPIWNGEDSKSTVSLDADAAQRKAEGFLETYYGEDYARMALYDDGGAAAVDAYTNSYSFHYAQRENGYFYAGNYYDISIDASDGSVSSFCYYFDHDVTFDGPDGIVSADTALGAYFNTYTVELGYLAVPEKLDPNAPEWKPYIDGGYSYLYSLRLAYSLDQEDYVAGIDAKTGEPVVSGSAAEVAVTYDDMDGHWAQTQAEKLAQYNVGWLGGSFHPASQLTQFDLLCLLVSTEGYLYDPSNPDESAKDYVYDIAYSMSLLTPAERADNQVITRGELVKMILNAGGYGKVANLTGIFRCAYTDESSIPAAYYGYAALAQGLGIVSGDGGGSFACNRSATRAEAAVMLYNLMNQ